MVGSGVSEYPRIGVAGFLRVDRGPGQRERLGLLISRPGVDN